MAPRLVRVAAAVVLVLFVSAAGAARTKHRVIRVPRDAATLPAAIRLAAPGDLILLGRGVYRGAVVVPPTKRRITIRGVDRNRVVFDGHDERRTAILVHADGVTLENFSAHNYLGNALFWEGVKGFRASYLTIWNVGRYGIYVEGSADGVIDHDYISGAADAAYYVGECNPCHATLTHLVARLSAVGYSGTNASGGLVIRDSLWDRNAAGILPNSYANEEDPPQQSALITGNSVVGSGRARVPLRTPLAGFYGIGIGIAGGNMDRVEGNRVSGSLRYGIAVFPTAYWVPMPFDPRPVPPGRHEPWRPQGNVIRGNTVTGSSVADLALADGSGPGNCFAANQATSTLPQDLQAGCTPDSVGDPLVATELTAPIPAMVDRALRRLGEKPYTAMPVPPPQPSMPTR